MKYARKIKETAWFGKNPEDADSISDLLTNNHDLSVWGINDINEKKEFDRVVLALAMTRNTIEEFYVVLIDLDEFNQIYPNNRIELHPEKGETQYLAMVDKHTNFVLPLIWNQYDLSKYIHEKLKDKVNYRYYSPTDLKMLFDKAVGTGDIQKTDVKNAWATEYKIIEKRKKILVLPGAVWQVPIVNKIRQMGHSPIVVSPAENSPAFEYAHRAIQSDIFAKQNYLEDIKKMQVNAVLSDECDIATKLIAELADELHLPSQGQDMAELYTNKVCMREFLRDHNLPCPAFQICHSLDEALVFYRNLNKQMIIKPIDSNSSHGVFTIHNEDELKTHFAEAQSFSREDKAVICEQYIYGTEFTVDGIMTPFGHTCLAISEKKHYAYNENIAYELFFSHDNPNFDYDLLRRTNDQFVNLSGLPFGLTHAEYKYQDGQFYLIEIGARGGGNLISAEIVPCMSGYDNYGALIKMALGEKDIKQPSIAPELQNRCAVLEFFDAPGNGGVVKAIEGEEFLSNNFNILSYQFNFKVGDTILQAACDTARIGFYIAYADSREELKQLMQEIQNKVKFIM